jgi:uncharacterized protein YbaR (Trm112 family)
VHVELIDRLRCPGAHEESWLVAHATETEERRILEGTLGCPICHREYRITRGEVWMGSDEPDMVAVELAFPSDPEPAMRLAALLNVADDGGLYLLEGMLSTRVLTLAPAWSARWLLLAPPIGISAEGTIRGAGDAIPLARGSVRGIALTRPSSALATAAVAVLGSGGRLVAPAQTRVPDGMEELARDDEQWVAQKVAGYDSGVLITPRRAAPRTTHR